MSLLCGTNTALESIKDAGKSLKAQLTGGKNALGSIGGMAASIKSKVDGLKAKAKQLESFQTELANLPANLTAGAIASLKAKWGSRVPDINSYVDKLKNGVSIDFCKEIPNINIDAETGATVQQAKTSPTPNSNPPDVDPVDKTAINNYEKKSTGNSEQIPSEVQAAYFDGPVKDFRETISKPVLAKGEPLLAAVKSATSSKNYASVKEKLKKTGRSSEQLLADGQLNQAEIGAVKAHDRARNDLEDYNISSAALNLWWLTVQEYHSGFVTDRDLDAAEKRNRRNASYAEYLDFFDKTRALGETHSDAIKKYAAVMNNRPMKE